MPREYVLTRSLARSRRPTSSSSWSTRRLGTLPASASKDRVAHAENCGKNWGLSTSAPIFGITRGSAAGTSSPRMLMRPSLGLINPNNVRSVVVFPEPLGPRKPCTSPAWTTMSNPSSACRGPRRKLR